MKNLKKKIEEIIDKIKNDKEFAKKFKKDPVKALEDVSGIDIPEDKIEEVITAVQAKVKIDKVDDALDKLKGLFKQSFLNFISIISYTKNKKHNIKQ